MSFLFEGRKNKFPMDFPFKMTLLLENSDIFPFGSVDPNFPLI